MHVEKLATPVWAKSGAQKMDKEYTQTLGERISKYQTTEWKSLAGMEGFYFTVIAGADFGRVF